MNFDLNINNYTRDELIDMFDLPVSFDKNIIDIKEAKLRENIINNKEINKETQIQTINFLVKAKNIIINGVNGINSNPSDSNKNPVLQRLDHFMHTAYDLKPTPIEDSQEHMVQNRKESPYLSSSPSEFFPGIINPIKKRTLRKNLNIDSRFRENYYASISTNYNINLPINLNNVLQMTLSSIEIPTSFFVVSKQYGNNFFSVKINGNYEAATLMNIINTQLQNLGGDFASIVFTDNLTGSHTGTRQTIVGLSDLSVADNFELNFQADRFGIDDRNTPLPLKMGWVLGFRNGIYVNNQNYVSEGLIDLTGPKYLFLVVDDHNNNVNNNFYSAFNSSILNKNILARISITQTTSFTVFSENNFNLVTNPREYFGPVNLQILNIQLLDEYGRIVDLNNMDFSFCLSLVTVYDI